jgi:three-Cys-motif partner protein
VDAFAGPWKVTDNAKFSDASFDQAINTLEAVRADLEKKGIGGLKIRFCLCELRSDRVARLREYAATNSRFEIHIFEGAFEDNLERISAKLPDGFTFTFIDPTGWNIRNKEVFNFLREQGGEFLLNFMSDHINRHSEYPAVAQSFGRFLADPDWEDEFAALPSDWSNERKMLELLKSNMKRAEIALYLPDFSIRLPRQERLKMRLVLGTHSRAGLELFRDIQYKVERQEIDIRRGLREGETRQVSLFSAADHAEFEQEQKGVGCRRNKALAEEMIKTELSAFPECRYDEIIYCIIEQIPIRRTQLNTLVCDMKKRGVVLFELPPRKRVPQPSTQISLAADT